MIWPRTPISAGSFSERKPAHRRRPPRLPADARTALNGLQTLRTNPGAAREDREKYASFFGDIRPVRGGTQLRSDRHDAIELEVLGLWIGLSRLQQILYDGRGIARRRKHVSGKGCQT